MMEKGFLSYLDYVHNTSAKRPLLESMGVVREFIDLFPSNLPEVLLVRYIDLGWLKP